MSEDEENQDQEVEELEENEDEENEEEEGEEVANVVADGTQQTIVVEAPQEPAEPELPTVVQPVPIITLKPKRHQTEAWIKVIDTLRKLGVNEATFTYNGNLHVRENDKSRVSLVDAEIDMELGISALVTTVPPVIRKFSCDLMKLKRALKMWEPTITIGETEAVFKEKDRADLVVPLQEDSDEQLPLPNLNLTTSTKADINTYFSDLAKYLGVPPEALDLRTTNGNLSISGTNNEGQKFVMRNFSAEGPDAAATYNTQLLKTFRDGWKLTYATDQPIKAERNEIHIEYVSGSNGYDSKKTITASITAWIAPRIETDE